jgi:Binding-protein-dependent transport system inner membrane component
VVAQLRRHRAALRHLPGVDPEAGAGAADHPGVRHRARLQGGGRHRADPGGLDPDRYAGVKALDPDGEKLFYSLGATRLQVFRKLVVPFCLPWIISVLRVNIGLALTGAIVGEFIASQHGLGRAILYAGQTYDIALVWVAVLVLSTLAVIMYATVSWLESMLRKGVKQ